MWRDQVPVPDRPPWVLARRRQLGHHIAQLREERDLTVDGLADRSSLDRKTVMRAEHATHSVGLDVLIQLAHGLGMPVAEMLAT